MHYDLKHLRVFVAVAEELNFHLAAERLGLTQPAVSRIVSDLEDRLGVQLLERTTRLVRLTDAGRFLLQEANELLPRIAEAGINVQRIARGTKGLLKVGYTTINGHAFVPDVVNSFRAANPEVQVQLFYRTAPQQRDQILTGELDCGFMEGSFHGSQIASRLAAKHRMLVLMSQHHPLAQRQSLRIEDIADEEIILGTREEWPTLRQFVTDVFQGEGRVLRIHQEAPTLTSILGFLTGDRGVTIFCGAPRFSLGALVSVPLITHPAVSIETHFAWRRGSTNAALRIFRDSVRIVGQQKGYLQDISAPPAEVTELKPVA